MRKKTKLTTAAITSTLLIFTLVGTVQARPYYNRFAGNDRFQTSTAIAQQEFQGQQMQNVVIASAYSYPDALSASTLATKLKASIILVGTDVNDSQVSLNFIKSHLKAGGNVTIIGGVGIINQKVEQWLHKAGYHVSRMGGLDRYATNSLIVSNLNISPGTPVIIASGNEFPDALGVASLAASKGWPILLSGPNQLPDAVKNFITTDQPTNIYIVGGKVVINDSLQTALQSIAPNAQIQRFGGQDRFETLSQILTKFYPNPTQIYLANGLDYSDALSGSTLAAQNNAPILLIDPKSRQLPPSIQDYLITIRNTGSNPQVNVLGGTVGVPDWVINQVNEIFGDSTTSPGTAPIAISSPSTAGFTVGLNPALNGLTINNFTLLNSSGYTVPIAGVTTVNGGATYTVSAALTAGQTYTLTANYAGNALGTAQSFTVPYSTNSTTLTVSNPLTTGLTVGLNPVLSGLSANNFTLLNSSGYTVPIIGATTVNGGATYTISAALTAGQTYTLTANYAGNTLGTAQSFTVPYSTNSTTLTVSNPLTTGLTVGLNPVLNGLSANNFTLLNSSGYTVPIIGVTTANGGATYTVSAALIAGQTYTLTANYAGNTLGTAQSFTVPYSTNSTTLTVSNPLTTGLTVGLNPVLNGLTINNFTLLNSSGYNVPIAGVTTVNGGATYTISAALTAGQIYTLTANYAGNTLGTAQSFTVPYSANNETLTVSGLSTTGLTVGLSSPLNGLTTNNFTLLDSLGNRIVITSVTTTDGGATYTISAVLNAGQTYTLTTNYAGYTLGTQSLIIPTVSAS
ncbi:cell wall-binding repeat-containing protein [Desulfosporosinus sp. PR]|uniref:cell wall-binding repeat-containing protein n=1 Tax=Candidatus Desulfosporosinus nitrosoreducens TaxID=3401928 RepID=UPI0027FEA243|nr:cell wall-binding repeat-containing protein [Desulfosporosinus sp. PR]MDQ7092630.1 cell wall-binding repeat-containing protein [Desulfosporosinus sp. PR]